MTVRNIIQYTLLLFLISIPLCSLIVMVYYAITYPEHFSWGELPILVITLAAYYILLCRVRFDALDKRTIIAASFIIANVSMAISLSAFDTQPCSDYIAIYGIAQDMADGSYDVRDYPYYHYAYIFNYQNGIAAFISLFIRVFGDNFWVLKIFNLLIINATLWLTYRVADRLCSRGTALIALLLMSTFYPVLITVNQFTNQHIATPLILLTLLALYRRKWQMWLVAGVVAGLTNILRPMGIILVLTAITYAVYHYMLHKRIDIQRIGTGAILTVAFMTGYLCCNAAFDRLFISLHYTDCPIGHTRLTYFKFDKGLTGYDYPDVADFGSIEEFNDWERDRLMHKLSDEPLDVLKYVSTKIIRYMGEYDWKFENTYDHDPSAYNHYPVKGFVIFGWGQYIVMALLAIVGYNRWRKSHDVEVFQIFYIGITAVYLLIEAFSSYRYESYPILMIFAALSFAERHKKLDFLPKIV